MLGCSDYLYGMKRGAFKLALLLLVFFSMPPFEADAAKIALVIGNDNYSELTDLQRAREDAAGYNAFLIENGFEVTYLTDQSRDSMALALANFYDKITPATTVVFVYSGHGWSTDNVNYLIPTDTKHAGSVSYFVQTTVPLKNSRNGIIDEISRRKPKLAVAIIDACRDNPFAPDRLTKAIGLGRGLGRIQAPEGIFIVFSAGANQVALDRLNDIDDEPYSVFTRHFLPNLRRGVDLYTAVKATQIAVSEAANSVGRQQRPAFEDETLGFTCLLDSCSNRALSLPSPPFEPPRQDAMEEWRAIEGSGNVEAHRRFIEKHSGTALAERAEKELQRLERWEQPVDNTQIAALPPAKTGRQDADARTGEQPEPPALGSDAPPPSRPLELTKFRTKTLQIRLKLLGYPVGAIDGQIGPATRSAVRSFQASKELVATGRVDEETWAQLAAAVPYREVANFRRSSANEQPTSPRRDSREKTKRTQPQTRACINFDGKCL